MLELQSRFRLAMSSYHRGARILRHEGLLKNLKDLVHNG